MTFFSTRFQVLKNKIISPTALNTEPGTWWVLKSVCENKDTLRAVFTIVSAKDLDISDFGNPED